MAVRPRRFTSDRIRAEKNVVADLVIGSWHRTIPLEGEAGRLFLQRRVFVFVRLMGVLALALVAINSLTERRSFAASLPELSIGALLLIAAALTHAAKTRFVVELLDAIGTVGVSIGFEVAMLWRHGEPRAELLMLLLGTNVLAARAALVPSTARRTFVIGLLTLAPLVPLTWFGYGVADSLHRTAQVTGWGVIILVATTLTSRRIYGLAESVEKARRLGQYTLEEKIGEGAMGEVYRASHAMLRRPTAVKLLRPSRNSEKDLASFEREVQLTSQLTHPNTIQIYDFGRGSDGTFYYAMEWIDGLTLEDLVRRYGALPPYRAAHVLADICGSLAEAHAAGLVHRDVKPQNIMLCARGGLFDVVKVLDFGLVRATRGEGDPNASAAIVGTPMYMAPEAIVSPETIDARADLYAVGAVGYFLLTGATVFDGDTLLGILGKQLHETPEPVSERAPRSVPKELAQIIHACLAKNPADRPASARTLHDAFAAIANEGPALDLETWWARHRQSPPTSLAYDTTQSRSLTRTLLPARII